MKENEKTVSMVLCETLSQRLDGSFVLLPSANAVLSKVMFYRCLSVHRGSLYDVISCLAAWFHVASRGISVSGPMLLQGGSLSRRSLSKEGGSLSRGLSVGGGTPCTVKNMRYASYWNAFLFLIVHKIFSCGSCTETGYQQGSGQKFVYAYCKMRY